jgi:glycosyltransferase involved in cell wall biosynthesis
VRTTVEPGLRVLHAVATENFAGVERYVSYVVPELARRGLQAVVLGGDERRMLTALAGTGVEHRRSANVVGVVRSLLAERRADVIHAHMTSAEIAGAICKPLLRSGLVVTRHFAAGRGSNAIARAAGRTAARQIDRQIAISEYVARRVEGPSDVLLSGVPRAEAGAHGDAIVLVAQRMEAEKDGSLVLRAWALSGLADRGWKLLFAGDGAERDRLEGLASHHGVADSVSFLGFVDDVPALMSRSSLLLASAPAEPFGLTVVEAMARGLPVVAAAGGGHLETVGAVSPETMFPPGDAAAAADLLRRLGTDPGLRRRTGEQLLDFQRRKLSLEAHTDRLLEVYASVVETRRGTRLG